MKTRYLVVLLAGLMITRLTAQTPINPLFYGQNYWFTNMSQLDPADNTDLSST